MVIYNGIGQEYVIEEKMKERDQDVNFLISGRISDSKGQSQAIQASKILIAEGIQNFKLYLAGSGKISYEHSAELDKHLIFMGMQKDMISIRKRMNVELVCSAAEAFGRVTVEAMMAGMPVIGSDVGGTSEIIKDGKNGLLYELNDVDDLASKMKFMIFNPIQQKEMGKYARMDAIERFSRQNCVRSIEQVYQKVLQNEINN